MRTTKWLASKLCRLAIIGLELEKVFIFYKNNVSHLGIRSGARRDGAGGELFRGVQEGKEDWGNMGQGVQAGSENMERECVT